MTCWKSRIAFRPLLENLESRLQPGSVLMGQAYGGSLLIDNLSIGDQGSFDSIRLISQSSSETSRTALANRAVDVPTDHQGSTLASVMIARNASSDLSTSSLIDDLTPSLTNDDLGLLSSAGQRNAARMLAVQDVAAQPIRSTPGGINLLEASIGVATPAPAATKGTDRSLGNLPSPGGSAFSATRAPASEKTPAATALGAAQPLPLNASNGPAPVLRPLTNLQTTTSHISAGGVHTLMSQPVWATYVGGPGEDKLLGVALNSAPGAAQPVLATGYMQSATDPTEFDGMLALISTDGTTATILTLGFGSGTRTEGHSVDVDSAGNVYVIGQVAQTSDPVGTSDVMVVRVDPTGTLSWAFSLTPSGSVGVGNGLKLNTAGTNLYVTGGIDDKLLAAELTDLSSATPTVVYASTFSSAAGALVGTAIAPDSVGNADLGFTLTTSGTTDNRPGFGQVAPDGTLAQSAAFPSIGPNSGTFGITVDASDNFYLTGGIEPSSSAFDVLLVAKYDASFTRQYAFTYQFNDAGTGNQVNAVGRAIQVDNSGDAFMAVVRDGGTISSGGTGVFMKLFEVAPDGGTSLDNQQAARGTGDDENRALALDTTNNVAYMVGFTSSPDFNFTTSSFQPTYGGGPFDGVVIQEHLS